MAILTQRQPPPGFTTDTVNSAQVASKKKAKDPFAGVPVVKNNIGPTPSLPAPPVAPPVSPTATTNAPAADAKNQSIGDFLNADYSSDPTLQGIISAERDSANQTVSGIDDQIRALLIQTGLKGVAESQLGAGSPYLDAITDDPNGTSAASRLNKDYQDKQRSTDEQLNDEGLFHSGARVSQVSDLGHQHVLDQTDLANQLLSALQTLHDAQTAARTGATKNIANAEADARDRAIALALQYGAGADTTGGNDGSGGNDTTTTTKPPPAPSGSAAPPAQNPAGAIGGHTSGGGLVIPGGLGTAPPPPHTFLGAGLGALSTPTRTTASASQPAPAAAPAASVSAPTPDPGIGAYLASILPPQPAKAAVPGQIVQKGKPVYA